MPDMNDFFAFRSTSSNGSGGGGGCLPFAVVIGVIVFILYLIGRIS